MSISTLSPEEAAGGRASGFAARLAALRAHPAFASSAPVLRFLFAFALVAYLVYCLSQLGWVEIWNARPTNWAFYALLPVSYLVLPVADLIIYRRLWRAGPTLGLRVPLRKSFMNSTFFDFSGETYMFLWARRRLGLAHGFLINTIRDSSILSAIAGWSFLVGLLVYLTLSGHWLMPYKLDSQIWFYLGLASLPVIVVAVVVVASPKVTTLGARDIAFTFSVHTARVVIGQSLHVAMWALALPSVPLWVWLNLLAIRLVISRLGFLPSRELLLLGAGLSVASALDVPQAGLAAVLLIIAASEQLFHLVFVGLPSLFASARAARPAEAAQ